ncbi:MAG: TatD DNase family protein, partial [Patescibacteria group bacterium]|nr:TatD DNase family protein [Patescibacteria group bacterium]
MEIRYFDIHSHLNLKPLLGTKEEVIFRMKEKGVGTITVGTDLETSKEAVKISHTNEYFFATVGLHPTEHREDFDSEMFLELAKDENVVALGETGLDYYRLGDSDKGLVDREEVSQK